MATAREAYDEFSCYTLALGDPAFPLQHVVDAHAAQQADADTKPRTLAFALVGLYLHTVDWSPLNRTSIRSTGAPPLTATAPHASSPHRHQVGESHRAGSRRP